MSKKKKVMTIHHKLLIESYNQVIDNGGCLKVKGITKDKNKGFSDFEMFKPKQVNLF